jgi:hypothetical protein
MAMAMMASCRWWHGAGDCLEAGGCDIAADKQTTQRISMCYMAYRTPTEAAFVVCYELNNGRGQVLSRPSFVVYSLSFAQETSKRGCVLYTHSHLQLHALTHRTSPPTCICAIVLRRPPDHEHVPACSHVRNALPNSRSRAHSITLSRCFGHECAPVVLMAALPLCGAVMRVIMPTHARISAYTRSQPLTHAVTHVHACT